MKAKKTAPKPKKQPKYNSPYKTTFRGLTLLKEKMKPSLKMSDSLHFECDLSLHSGDIHQDTTAASALIDLGHAMLHTAFQAFDGARTEIARCERLDATDFRKE